jgi:hypothetical protein
MRQRERERGRKYNRRVGGSEKYGRSEREFIPEGGWMAERTSIC